MITIKDLLLSKGIKPTHQRLAILKFLENNREHLTADGIYRRMVKQMPTISKNTVYNTLNKLAGKSVITAISITGKEARFDFIKGSHHHFFCEKCGGITDIDIECPNCKLNNIQGNLVREIHGYFKGICKDCLHKK
ncbi:MAG: Fur family transcriptional regulator [Elusimicrobiota bacterium]